MKVRKKEKPIALDAYETMAEEYTARIETKSYNAYLERPATLSLLPDVKGKHVLDAGCGPGLYAEILLNRGAIVTAIDISPKMIHFAKKRLGDRATIRCANLEEPLDYIADKSVDIVLSSLVLDYIRNWSLLFSEFSRILRNAGYFIFSTEHPHAKWANKEHPRLKKRPKNYYKLEIVDLLWTGFGTPVLVSSYRRPLQTFFECLHATGFHLDKLIEPQPTEDFKRQNPEDWEKVSRNPTFICIRAQKYS
ncbi:MAG: class I SAM-dependent methyltransferase [Candidatus Thorarchaeota archaeon]